MYDTLINVCTDQKGTDTQGTVTPDIEINEDNVQDRV